MHKKIINQLLVKGKATVSEKIVLQVIKSFNKLFIKNHKKCINKALINITPLIKVKQLKQKRKRSRLKEFPYIISNKTRISLALKYFVNKTNSKSETNAYKKFINELLNAVKNTGTIVNKKKSLYEYAFIKKKYFYYRWF